MEKQYDKIEKYLWGDMSEAEKRAFEQELSQNKALKKELNFHREMRFLHKNEPLLELNEKLKNITQGNPAPPRNEQNGKPSASGNQWIWGISFVILVLVAGSIWYLNNWSRPAHVQLANQYLQPFESVFNLPPGNQNPLSEGMAAYNNGRYRTAIQQLEPLANTPDLQLYLAVSYLMEEQASEAIPLLVEVSSQADPVLQPAAEWYLALGYVMQGQFEAAQPLLDELKENENYALVSQALLNELKEKDPLD